MFVMAPEAKKKMLEMSGDVWGCNPEEIRMEIVRIRMRTRYETANEADRSVWMWSKALVEL